jgi:Zn-dependent protease
MFDWSQGSLYIGRIARIPIRIHWLLLIFWGLKLMEVLRLEHEHRRLAFGIWLAGTAVTFLSILLHELGHCFAARRVGGDASEIIMWPLGGLAMCHAPEHWRNNLIVAAGGPLVTAAIVAVGYPTFELLDRASVDWSPLAGAVVELLRWYVVEWNFYILIFNLIPLYPLDGGRIFHSLAWAWYARASGFAYGGRAHASRLTVTVSYVTAAAGIVYGIAYREQFVIIICVWALLSVHQLREDRW